MPNDKDSMQRVRDVISRLPQDKQLLARHAIWISGWQKEESFADLLESFLDPVPSDHIHEWIISVPKDIAEGKIWPRNALYNKQDLICRDQNCTERLA